MVRCNCDCHHPIESEVEESEIHEEEVPKELAKSPIKSNHGVYYNSIYDGLDENVWKLNDNLQKKEDFLVEIQP